MCSIASHKPQDSTVVMIAVLWSVCCVNTSTLANIGAPKLAEKAKSANRFATFREEASFIFVISFWFFIL
jgi:hypothetical protein